MVTLHLPGRQGQLWEWWSNKTEKTWVLEGLCEAQVLHQLRQLASRLLEGCMVSCHINGLQSYSLIEPSNPGLLEQKEVSASLKLVLGLAFFWGTDLGTDFWGFEITGCWGLGRDHVLHRDQEGFLLHRVLADWLGCKKSSRKGSGLGLAFWKQPSPLASLWISSLETHILVQSTLFAEKETEHKKFVQGHIVM